MRLFCRRNRLCSGLSASVTAPVVPEENHQGMDGQRDADQDEPPDIHREHFGKQLGNRKARKQGGHGRQLDADKSHQGSHLSFLLEQRLGVRRARDSSAFEKARPRDLRPQAAVGWQVSPLAGLMVKAGFETAARIERSRYPFRNGPRPGG
jgi:hypothetical protein